MWIGRRPDGTIYGKWTCKQPDDDDHLGMEEVDDDHLEAKLLTVVCIEQAPLDRVIWAKEQIENWKQMYLARGERGSSSFDEKIIEVQKRIDELSTK